MKLKLILLLLILVLPVTVSTKDLTNAPTQGKTIWAEL